MQQARGQRLNEVSIESRGLPCQKSAGASCVPIGAAEQGSDVRLGDTTVSGVGCGLSPQPALAEAVAAAIEVRESEALSPAFETGRAPQKGYSYRRASIGSKEAAR